MSAYYYFRTVQQVTPLAPFSRSISNAVVTSTITFVTPSAGKRIALTNLTIAANAAGTIAFYFLQSETQHEYKIAEFTSSGSAFINPYIQCWEATAVVAPIGIRVSTGLTNAWNVNAEGFELD